MVGAGAGAIITQRADAKAQAVARVCNSVIARSSAEAHLLAEHLTDLGILEDDHGPSTCTRPDCGGVVGPNDHICPHCGNEVGEWVEVSAEFPDEEILRGEERPVHAQEDEIYTEITALLDLPERLQEGLLEQGWTVDDAEEGGLILASIWPDFGPSDEAEYKKGLAEYNSPLNTQLLEPETLSRMLRQFQHCQDEETDTTLSIQAELRIFRNDDEWMVEVDDPLRDKVATGRKGRIQVGDFMMSEKLILKTLRDRSKRLPELGRKLLYYREGFFGASNVDDAEKVLDQEGCTQKDVAESAGIPRSTLCRWCHEKTGVWVDTPHGTYHLRDFFGRKVKVFRGEDVNKATVLGLILDAKQDLREKGQVNPERNGIFKWLEQNGHKLEMEERTKSWYFQQAEIMEKIIEISRLPDKEKVPHKILEILKQGFKIDIEERELQHYLDMIKIYEDHSK